jgi:hypothetical protein
MLSTPVDLHKADPVVICKGECIRDEWTVAVRRLSPEEEMEQYFQDF